MGFKGGIHFTGMFYDVFETITKVISSFSHKLCCGVSSEVFLKCRIVHLC